MNKGWNIKGWLKEREGLISDEGKRGWIKQPEGWINHDIKKDK